MDGENRVDPGEPAGVEVNENQPMLRFQPRQDPNDNNGLKKCLYIQGIMIVCLIVTTAALAAGLGATLAVDIHPHTSPTCHESTTSCSYFRSSTSEQSKNCSTKSLRINAEVILYNDYDLHTY